MIYKELIPFTGTPVMTEQSSIAIEGEKARIAGLHKYEVLDTSFDDIAQVASILLKAPVALMTTVNTNRIWFKSAAGTNIKESTCDCRGFFAP